MVSLEKAKAFAEPPFDVMEDCLRDLRRLDEILDPVHRYNCTGYRQWAAGDGLHRSDFRGDPRLIECRIIETKDKPRGFILDAWKAAADKETVEALRDDLIQTLKEVDPAAAQKFIAKTKERRLITHNLILS